MRSNVITEAKHTNSCRPENTANTNSSMHESSNTNEKEYIGNAFTYIIEIIGSVG